MGAATRGADEREVEVGILQLSEIGEDLIHEERDMVAVVILIDGIACPQGLKLVHHPDGTSGGGGGGEWHTRYVKRARVRHKQQPQRPQRGAREPPRSHHEQLYGILTRGDGSFAHATRGRTRERSLSCKPERKNAALWLDVADSTVVVDQGRCAVNASGII